MHKVGKLIFTATFRDITFQISEIANHPDSHVYEVQCTREAWHAAGGRTGVSNSLDYLDPVQCGMPEDSEACYFANYDNFESLFDECIGDIEKLR